MTCQTAQLSWPPLWLRASEPTQQAARTAPLDPTPAMGPLHDGLRGPHGPAGARATSEALVRQLRALGYHLEVRGEDALRVRPALPPELLDLVRSCKCDLVRYLRAEQCGAAGNLVPQNCCVSC